MEMDTVDQIPPDDSVPICGFPSEFHLLIPSKDNRFVLVETNGNQLRLPEVAPPREIGSNLPVVDTWSGDTETLCLWVGKKFKQTPYLRRMLWESSNPRGMEKAIIVVDFIDSELRIVEPATSKSMRWISCDMISKHKWYNPENDCDVQNIVNRFMQESEGESEGTLAPWRKRGWISRAGTVLCELLRQRGYMDLTELRQVRNMFHSSVLSCKIPGTGYAYLKSTLDCIPESQTTTAVAKLLPQYTANVILSHEKMFLQLATDGDYFEADENFIMRSIADMQLASLDCIDEFKAAGIRDRSLSWLSENISTLFEDEILEKNFPHHEGRLELVKRKGEISQLCRMLTDIGISNTIVHGDLDVSNIKCSIHNGNGVRVRFIDWANCSIAHPFYDYAYITTVGMHYIDNEDARMEYLRKWEHIRPMEDIMKAVSYAAPLMRCSALYDLTQLCSHVETSDERHLLKKLASAFSSILRHLDDLKIS